MEEIIYYDEFDEYEREDNKIIARCEECGEEIMDDNSDVYMSEDGFLCCLECAMRFYGIYKAEDSMVLNKD